MLILAVLSQLAYSVLSSTHLGDIGSCGEDDEDCKHYKDKECHLSDGFNDEFDVEGEDPDHSENFTYLYPEKDDHEGRDYSHHIDVFERSISHVGGHDEGRECELNDVHLVVKRAEVVLLTELLNCLIIHKHKPEYANQTNQNDFICTVLCADWRVKVVACVENHEQGVGDIWKQNFFQDQQLVLFPQCLDHYADVL